MYQFNGVNMHIYKIYHIVFLHRPVRRRPHIMRRRRLSLRIRRRSLRRLCRRLMRSRRLMRKSSSYASSSYALSLPYS